VQRSRGLSTTPELAEDDAVERFPASPSFLAVRLAIVALLIPVLWLEFGADVGEATAAVLVTVMVLFVPRALELDGQGFRRLSLVPRRKVPWSAVDSFSTGYTPRVGRFVQYTKAGRTPRWWYPAGWPAQGGITPAFASRRGGRALSATDLCSLLSDRLARARASD
jgi:hypothetical protein